MSDAVHGQEWCFLGKKKKALNIYNKVFCFFKFIFKLICFKSVYIKNSTSSKRYQAALSVVKLSTSGLLQLVV